MTSSLSDSEYGRLAELAAAWRLRLAGFRVRRDVRVAGRQVDLVARRGGLLVLCEVKARRHGGRGEALEAVGAQQQRRLREAAEALLAGDRSLERVRFDVVAVQGLRLRHVRAAF
jgi:putative endonuclease